LNRRSVSIASALALAVALPIPIAAASATGNVSHGHESLPPVLTLEDAQRIALANHPNLKASLFDQSAASEAVKIARAGLLPQVSGAAVQAVAPGGTRIAAYNALTNPTVIQRTAVGVSVAEFITDFGRTGALIRATQLDLRAQAAASDATRETIVLNVTEAYFEVLRADALLDVANATVRERQTLLHQVSALQRAGLRSILDVAIGRRDEASAEQLVLQAENARLDAYATLAEALGTPTFRIFRLADPKTPPLLPATLDGVFALALTHSPELAESRARSAAASARADAAARLRSPTITGYGFFGASPFNESNTAIPSPYAAAGVSLNVPLYTGGERAAQRRQAADAAAAANELAVEQENLLLRDVRTAFENVRTARGNIAVTEQLLATARQAFDLTQARYRIGLSSIVDLSQAQLSEEQAAIERTNATYDFMIQENALEFAAGLLANGGARPEVPYSSQGSSG
jgi:outer membrane protein